MQNSLSKQSNERIHIPSVKRITIELSIANFPYVTRREDGGESEVKATLFRYFSIKGAMTGEAWRWREDLRRRGTAGLHSKRTDMERREELVIREGRGNSRGGRGWCVCGSDLQWEHSTPLSTGRKKEHVAIDPGKLGIRVEGQIGELFYPWWIRSWEGRVTRGELAEDRETNFRTALRAHLRFVVTCVKAHAAGLCLAPATVISAQEEAYFTGLRLE